MTKLKIVLLGILFISIIAFGYLKYNHMNINDIALKVLSWVKKIKGDAVDLKTINSQQTNSMNHDQWTTLLKKHVTDTGKVNYKGFMQDSESFKAYLSALSSHVPGNNWSQDEKLVYWINAYNAFTIKLIIDNYPLKSIKNIGDGLPMIDSPWDIKFFKIGDQDFDLNTIEHEILRKQFNEPRIHFAINCASFSCPIIRNEAFEVTRIDQQLNEQASNFINNIHKNKIDARNTKLSKIFDWFQSDFGGEASLLKFIKQYAPSLNEANKIEYIDYDWTLNE